LRSGPHRLTQAAPSSCAAGRIETPHFLVNVEPQQTDAVPSLRYIAAPPLNSLNPHDTPPAAAEPTPRQSRRDLT